MRTLGHSGPASLTAHAQDSESEQENIVLESGDIVVVRNLSQADGVAVDPHNAQPFMLFRLNRRQERERTAPRSHVFGHQLLFSNDNCYVFDAVDTTQTRVFIKICSGRRKEMCW